jgi:hypothetical protein
MKIYNGRTFIEVDDDFFEVELYSEDKKLKKLRGYIYGDTVYIYRGKVKDQREMVKPGIYIMNKEQVFHSKNGEMEKYHVSNIIELDANNIFNCVENNKEDFFNEDDIDIINSNSEIFTTIIRDDDDFLKKAIKEAINQKEINLRVYKNKFKNEHSLNNMKSALNKKSKMTVNYFIDWCFILGLDAEVIIRDKGKDKNNPLKNTISFCIDD